MAVAGILRAGLVVVNVNPLYTARELEHQLKDSIARPSSSSRTLDDHGQCIANTAVKHVVLAAMGDLLGLIIGQHRQLCGAQRQKMVPGYSLPQAVRLQRRHCARYARQLKRPHIRGRRRGRAAVHRRHHRREQGAVLLHRNVLANVLQSEPGTRR